MSIDTSPALASDLQSLLASDATDVSSEHGYDAFDEDDPLAWFPEHSVSDEEWESICASKKAKKAYDAAIKELPLEITPSEFTAFAFRMPKLTGYGYERFSFEGRRHMFAIYNTSASRVLLCCARQTEKSTTLGNITLNYSCLIPAFKTLYVSPSAMQTKVFSNDRIKEPIETSPVLKTFTNRVLAQNVFEKQFINRSKVTLRYSFLNADRCVVGSTRAYFEDGTVATLQSIFEQRERYLGKRLLAVDPSTNELVAARLDDVVAQGVRSVFDVRVLGGATLRCTDNQPLLTRDGWAPLADLRLGSFVAVPHKLPHGPGLEDSCIEEFRLIGYLLGDGNTKTAANIRLSNGIPRVIEDFRRCAEALGIPLHKLTDCNKKHWVHSETKTQGLGGKASQYKGTRLLELGLLGAVHNTKRVPPQFFRGDEAQVREFLNAIYATDGWACVSTRGQYEIGYASNSEGLLRDMKQLLLRFGIQAIVSRQKKPSTSKALGAFALSIRHHTHVLRFCDHIGIFGKEREVAAVRAVAAKVHRAKNDIDRIPYSYDDLRKYLLARYGLSTHAAWCQHRIQLRPGNNKDSIGRSVLHTIATKLQDDFLLKMADSSIGWARIESITPAGTAPTFDLSIDRVENYLSDGIFVHNTRGIPAYMLLLDEIQDLLAENIPVIERCTDHAPDHYKRFIYSGTPKSLDNTIENYRSRFARQGEWVVPCERCGGGDYKYWNILGEQNIGKHGLICAKCGQLINPQHPDAQWAFMVDDAPFESYRINGLMVPWKKWSEIIFDYETNSRAKFFNEVLGLSYDSGTRPLTLRQVRNCCKEHISMHPKDLRRYYTAGYDKPVFMGIDYGTGENSYTIITIGTYVDSKFRIIYMERCLGEMMEPERQVEHIIELANRYKVTRIGADYGGGFDRNDKLMRTFGSSRLIKFQYMARAKKKIEWDPRLLRFKVQRTEVMSDIFNAIKRNQFEFPRWAEFESPYALDMLNIFSEYNEQLRQIQYKHSPDKPDDSFHSLLYCFLASMTVIPRPDVIAPRRQINQEQAIFGNPYTGPTNQGRETVW